MSIMRLTHKFLLFFCCFCCFTANAAYLKNVPRVLLQPNGDTLHCFISGDEFYCRLHDANNYTIVQNPATGYFVYAMEKSGKVVPSNWVAGSCNPETKGLRPNICISKADYMARRKAAVLPAKRNAVKDANTNKGHYNNLVIFIRFSDDSMFTNSFSSVNLMFNDSSNNYTANSMFDYFKTASYNQLFIHTTFYPAPDGEQIISYQDSFPRGYFMPWSETNPIGYQENDSVSNRTEREHGLLARAVTYVENMIPQSIDIDYNNDGYVDNICFVVKGNVGDWNVLLWPHRWSLYMQEVYLHGKRVWDYNLQLADGGWYFSNSVMCHEMFHTLGAPDLYHYYDTTDMDAVGEWDLMCQNQSLPQQSCAYMKYKYGNWITENDIIPLEEFGTYTILPLNSPTSDRICYRFATEDPLQWILMDFRNRKDPFDSSVPGRGMIFYRINAAYSGNADYNGDDNLDEVYVFRKDGSIDNNGTISNANFRGNISSRCDFSPTTNPYPFLSNGEVIPLHIGNLTSGADSMQFDFLQLVGVEELTQQGFFLSPNPTHHQLTIHAETPAQRIYRVYNVFGQQMDQWEDCTSHLSLNVSRYAAGCYFLKIFENQKNIKTIKFIKQ